MTKASARPVTLTSKMLSRQRNTLGRAKCASCCQEIIEIDLNTKIVTKKNGNKTKWYHIDCAYRINLVEVLN